MSLIPGNTEYLAFAYQAHRDVPAVAPVIAVALEDNSLDPGVQRIITPESDRSAQQGNQFVVGAEPGGTFKKYSRPNEEDFFLGALLGRAVEGGTTGAYTHDLSIDPFAPFNSQYLTIWDVWPGVAAVRYQGCRIGQAAFTGQPGAGIEVEYTILGLKATMGVDEPDVTGLFIDEEAYVWPEIAISWDDADPGITNQLSLTINRNTSRFVGDNGLQSLDCPNGLLAITGSAEVAFQDDALMRAANTGTTTGTDLTTTVYDETLAITLTRGGASPAAMAFALAAVQLANVKTALKTDGSPAVTTFDFSSKRQADITTAIAVAITNAAQYTDRVAPFPDHHHA